jgi:small subunit ribosomal protein S15
LFSKVLIRRSWVSEKIAGSGLIFRGWFTRGFFSDKIQSNSQELKEDILSITKETKQKLIGRFQINGKDTGSSEVQVSILTERIRHLTEHFKTHKKDNHSRKGLLTMVSTRKKLLNYLRRTNYDKYVKIIQELELRK